ncbi:MAG: hypothetical protein QM296_05085 [Bacillota bacterium]|nr:hypothetical protein [Bacillota bacterium]
MERKILLSADETVSLYKVSEDIWEQFDTLLDDFFKWKKTKYYDETLFVKFLKNRFGETSISFIRTVGEYAGEPNMIIQNGKNVTEQYKDIRWFNF